MATDAEKNGIEKTCESDTPITIGSEKTSSEKTEIGSYFISNYPPFSQWKKENLSDVEAAMANPPADVPLGLYLHIPFCRDNRRLR